MRVLVVGRGGREHALVWKLGRSPSVTKVFCAPGNPGTGTDAVNVPIKEDDHRELVRFCAKEKIDLVVIGPEAPLVAGLADDLRAANVAVFGPSKQAAMLEGSKSFSKKMMRKANIPTADAHVFTEFFNVEEYLLPRPGPCVVKADGLAAGKGVAVCDGFHEALDAAHRMLVEEEFGPAGKTILVEERLAGEEASILALTDGHSILSLEPCQDHKRAFDGDTGPNTGGMGAYCPAKIVTPQLLAEVEEKIFVPLVHQLKLEKMPYRGVIYAGLMLTPNGPKVLEFNVRFGDPECQPLLMRLKSDLGKVLMSTATGKLASVRLEWDERPAVCVVMASGGYPGKFKKEIPIHGLDALEESDDQKVFHAGTAIDAGRIETNGGRVLGATALGADLPDAKRRAYELVAKIKFTNALVRSDIADKEIRRTLTAELTGGRFNHRGTETTE